MEVYINESLAAGIIRPTQTLIHHSAILQLQDPDRQFMVEVDASDVGVGAVLSQRSASDQKVHPCAFFSLCLSTAERNYNIGALALKEWRHWLEGAKVPFIIWTDHENLEYVSTPKRLNSLQAR